MLKSSEVQVFNFLNFKTDIQSLDHWSGEYSQKIPKAFYVYVQLPMILQHKFLDLFLISQVNKHKKN